MLGEDLQVACGQLVGIVLLRHRIGAVAQAPQEQLQRPACEHYNPKLTSYCTTHPWSLSNPQTKQMGRRE